MLWVEAHPVDESIPTTRSEELAQEFRAVVTEIMDHRGIGAIASRLLGVDDPSQLADLAGYSPDLSLAQKVQVLEEIDVEERLLLVLGWMNEILANISLREKIREDATSRIDKSQREYMLRQQLESIKKELGDADGDVAGEYRQKLIDRDLPEKVAEAVDREGRQAGADERAEP